MSRQFVNSPTIALKPYPMEQLSRIRQNLIDQGKKVFDFGTGDPKIPCWPKINEALIAAIPSVSQYPSARGSKDLINAQWTYLQQRFNLTRTEDIQLMATRGSKEAVFHVAQSIIGRSNGKRTIIYPDPGYPVYYSSTIFAGGQPYPVRLVENNNYLLEPWNLPVDVQNDAAAIWINYPHNPTGAIAPKSYFEEVIHWAHKNDCLVLSDDCYIDIYDAEIDDRRKLDERPICPLSISSDRVISFFSLSKRSGLTGYRSGFMAGDSRFILPHLEARANMGVGSPQFIEVASAVAWRDEEHVAERRKIFTQRINTTTPYLQQLGLIDEKPKAAFYLWARVPTSFGDDDVRFCLELAEKGIITSPSQWLSNDMRGYFRLALVPDANDTQEAMELLQAFVKSKN